MAKLKRRQWLTGLGYSVGDVIGPNMDPGWSGPAMRILSLGSGDPVHWNTGGSANITLPAFTKMQPTPRNGYLYELQPNGFLTSSRDPAGVEFISTPENEAGGPIIRTSEPDLPIGYNAGKPPAKDIVIIDKGFAPVSKPPATTVDVSEPESENGGDIPVWLLVLGGAALLYFLSDRK